MLFPRTLTHCYNFPTCTLEIIAHCSPLSSWSKRPVLKELQFKLSLQDPKTTDGETITLEGDRAQLTALGVTVADYVQTFLKQSPAALVGKGVDAPGQPLSSQVLNLHEIPLMALATETSNSTIALSTIGLFDLANALDECAVDLALLSKELPPGWKKQPARGMGIAAGLVLVAGLSSVAFVWNPNFLALRSLFERESGTASEQGDRPQPPPAQSDSLATPPPAERLARPDKLSAPIASSEKLPPPPPVETPPQPENPAPVMAEPEKQLPAVPKAPPQPEPPATTDSTDSQTALATARSGQNSDASTPSLPDLPRLTPKSDPTPDPTTAQTQPQPSPAPTARQTAPAPQVDPPTLSSRLPQLPAQTFLPQESDGQAPAAALEGNSNPTPETLFDKTPQVTQVRQYFQARWQPPDTLDRTLEYILVINHDGSLERIIPLGEAAGTYLDRTQMPLLGEPFVSSTTAQSNSQIRLVLSPDGTVKTFLEASR